jgi:multiple sugar transport system substrate-binding protein
MLLSGDGRGGRGGPARVTTGRRDCLRAGAAVGAVPLLALAGCGVGGGAPAGGQSPAQSEVAGTTVFWQWGAGYNPGFQTLVDEFNAKHGGVTVTFDPGVVSTSSTSYWDKLTAALAGSVGPDVFLMNTNARSWAAQGQLRELTPLIARDKEAAGNHAQALKAFDEWYRIDGKVTGWPWDYSTIASHVNLAHLESAGLAPPLELGDKWTWTALLEYAQKLTKRGATPQDTRYGFIAVTNDEGGWLNFVYANGGSYFSPDLKRCTLAQPPAVEAIEFLAELVQKHRVAPTAEEISATGRSQLELFEQGLASMWTAGDWNFQEHLKVPGFRWEASFVPKAPKTGKTESAANLRGLVMSAQSKQVEPTWEFMKFLLTKPVQDRVTPLVQEVPARLDSANETYANPEKAGPPAGRRLLKESIQATRALPAHYNAPLAEYRNQVSAVVADVINGKVGVRDGMKQAEDAANAVFQRYGS